MGIVVQEGGRLVPFVFGAARAYRTGFMARHYPLVSPLPADKYDISEVGVLLLSLVFLPFWWWGLP
jgi:hypothetical protein